MDDAKYLHTIDGMAFMQWLKRCGWGWLYRATSNSGFRFTAEWIAEAVQSVGEYVSKDSFFISSCRLPSSPTCFFYCMTNARFNSTSSAVSRLWPLTFFTEQQLHHQSDNAEMKIKMNSCRSLKPRQERSGRSQKRKKKTALLWPEFLFAWRSH